MRLEQAGLSEARLLVPLTFSVIIGTVLVQGLTARPFAKLLNVVEPNNNGYLINAANPVAIEIAKVLKELEIKTILCDSNWENISNARMAGLNTYYGNPISHHADLYLDTTGIGGILGLSFDQEKNRSTALRYQEDFGPNKVFSLAGRNDKLREEEARYVGHALFGDEIFYGNIAGMISRKAKIKQTTLSEEFSFDDWKEVNKTSQSEILFYLDPKNKLRWKTADQEHNPDAGWTIAYLTLPTTETV